MLAYHFASRSRREKLSWRRSNTCKNVVTAFLCKLIMSTGCQIVFIPGNNGRFLQHYLVIKRLVHGAKVM